MKKIIMFDIDDTICRTINAKYSKSKPIKQRIKIVNSLYDEGYYIKIFTARYMGRNKENSSLVKKKILQKNSQTISFVGLKIS